MLASTPRKLSDEGIGQAQSQGGRLSGSVFIEILAQGRVEALAHLVKVGSVLVQIAGGDLAGFAQADDFQHILGAGAAVDLVVGAEQELGKLCAPLRW